MLEDWKNTFRLTELQFFNRPAEDWPEVFQTAVEDLDPNYGIGMRATS
jgi:hypothetical protein